MFGHKRPLEAIQIAPLDALRAAARFRALRAGPSGGSRQRPTMGNLSCERRDEGTPDDTLGDRPSGKRPASDMARK